MECRELESIPYEIDLDAVVKVIEERSARRVVIQLPDGIKQYSPMLSLCIKRRLGGAIEVYVSGEGSYGACDLDLDVLENTIKPDLIVHVGHTPYPPWLCSLSTRGRVEKASVVYVPAYSRVDFSERAVEEALEILRSYNAKRVGLVAPLQHVSRLSKLALQIERRGLEPSIPKGLPPYLLDGQVIGCEYRVATSIDVDAYLYLGGGLFHPLGLYLVARKPVVKIDPHEDRVMDVTPLGVKYLRIRLFKVQQAIAAKRWAIVVGLKTCQYRDWLVESLKKLLEDSGREYVLVATSVLTLERIADIDSSWIEAFVVTSCPRLPIDDLWEYHKPVLTPGEARMALAGTLEDYRAFW
ncbi:MAG: diphthamide biosynthesis enzyme Dph2 [Acidilobaceae archaeon]